MQKLGSLLAVCSLLFASFLANAQSSNVWLSAGQMTQARTGAAAVLLQDGRLLITGGFDANGIPQAAAEFYDPASGAFSAAPSMNVPRTNHAAIVLQTGDVLVTGGVTDPGGDYTNTAEIFSAGAQQWTQLQATLAQGLAGHAMALLSDGNVLLAGGESTTGPVGTLLLFNATDDSITSIGSLMTARTNAAAAATPDGRVLIAGGTDINNNVLGSTEIFVYSTSTLTGTVSAGPMLTYSRTAATATATFDGVAVIGGYNVQNGTQTDLGTAEIFSQWTNAFRVVSGATPRSGHFALLLPNNGAILAMGGTGGQAVDLLQPWANSLAGAFVAASSSLSNHNGGFAAPVSLGALLAAGGQGAAANAAELYWFPTIATDQPDYAPGTQVVMTGTGFKPGEIVDLHLHEWVNQTVTDLPDYTVTAGSNGAFTFTGYAPTTTDVGARYHLTAVGETSALQAQTIFTDANVDTIRFASSGLPAGASVGVNYSGTNNGGNSSVGTVTFASPGPSASGNPGIKESTNFSYTFPATITVSGTAYILTGTSVSPTSTSCTPASSYTDCFVTSSSGVTETVTGTYTVAAQIGSVSVGTQTGTLTYGTAGAATYTITVTRASGTNTAFTANLSIPSLPTGVSNGGFSPSSLSFAAADASHQATLTLNTTATAAAQTGTSFTVTATNASLTTDTQSGNGSLTIGQAMPTLSVTNSPATYNGNPQPAQVQASVSVSGTQVSGAITNITYTGTSGTSYGPSTVAPTNAGTYAVAADFAPTDSTDYQSLTGASAGTFVINKANVTVSFGNTVLFTYNGSAQAPTYVVNGVNNEVLTSSATVAYTGTGSTTYSSATPPTNAGTYSLTVAFAGNDNYNPLNPSATLAFTIQKANVTVSFGNTVLFTYNGSAQAPTYVVNGVNSEVLTSSATASYAGSQFDGTAYSNSAAPMNAGTYSLTVAFAGNDNYNSLNPSATLAFTIQKANVSVSFGNTVLFTYNGSAQAPSYVVNGVNSEVLTSSATASYAGSQFDGTAYSNSAAPTNAGSYTLTVAFAGTNNYNALSSSATQAFSIQKANVTVAFGNIVTFIYNGLQQSPTYAVNGVNNEVLTSSATASYTGSQFDGTAYSNSAAPMNAGTYTLAVTFAGTNNYNALTSSTTQAFTIQKAKVTVTFSNIGPFTYSGSTQTPTYVVDGVNSEVLTPAATASYTGTGSTIYSSPTAPTNAGTYTLTVAFAGTNNYNSLSAGQAFTISKAQPVFSGLPASQSIVVDTSSITLSGMISAPGPVYPPNGETVSITIDGLTASATIGANGTPGAFTATFNTQTIPVSASNYTITYTYGGDSNFLNTANTSTTLTVKYATGGICDGDAGHQILQPIDPAGLSVFKSTSTTPAKFRVCDANGVSIGTPGVVQSFLVIGVAPGTVATPDETVTSTTPDSAFRWDPTGQQWIFNISNKNLGPANQTYIFLITLNDGSTIPFQYGLR